MIKDKEIVDSNRKNRHTTNVSNKRKDINKGASYRVFSLYDAPYIDVTINEMLG